MADPQIFYTTKSVMHLDFKQSVPQLFYECFAKLDISSASATAVIHKKNVRTRCSFTHMYFAQYSQII